MKHRTDLRRAHRRIRSLERQLGHARERITQTEEVRDFLVRDGRRTRDALAKAEDSCVRLAAALVDARWDAQAPLWTIAAARLRAWWRI